MELLKNKKIEVKNIWEQEAYNTGKLITDELAPKGFTKRGTAEVAIRNQYVTLGTVRAICQHVVNVLGGMRNSINMGIERQRMVTQLSINECESELMHERSKSFLSKNFEKVRKLELQLASLQGELSAFEKSMAVINK